MGQKRILVRVKKKKKISLLTVPFRDIGEMVSGFDERDVVGGGCIFIDMRWKLKKKVRS